MIKLPFMTTRIRTRELSRVFAAQDPLSAYIARLSVLYEDLRVESLAIREESISPFDNVTDRLYRKHYFFRRGIATLLEFAESLRLLDGCPDFYRIRSTFNAAALEDWAQAIQFFDKHECLIQRVRNDIGGHFGHPAAKFAVENLHPSVVGEIEIREVEKGLLLHLHFPGEIAATASIRHFTKLTGERKFSRLARIVVVGSEYATKAFHTLVVTYLWQRFGR
jgi:hypothetical protein